MILVYFTWFSDSFITLINDADCFRQWLESAQFAGPILVIGLLAAAIVVTPLPSAPIALMSGALYGHYFGTLYVILGSELGALIAFSLARLSGIDVTRKWLDGHARFGWLSSQNAMMFIVFVSRLLPFLSFDVISYVAGFTSLRFWRFALATLLGIIPVSFVLAHFGSKLVKADTQEIVVTMAVIGLLSSIPLAWRWTSQLRHNS